jgi:helix-turn-helix protein
VFEIGSSLRDARLRKGLDLPELEAETKIRAKYLRALEEERFDLLPGDTYVKGFLRIYAERLGLDGQLYVDEYNSRFSLAEEPVLATRARRRSRQGRFEAQAVLVALAAIVAITVLVIAAWQFGTGGEGGGGGSTAATGSQGQGTPTTAETGATPASRSVDVHIVAQGGPSRVEAREGTAAGKLLFEGPVEKGETITVSGTKVWLFVAKPRNVAVNGRRLAELAPGPATVVVTRLGIDTSGSQ